MARIAVNDCLERVPNRFELVLLAAERARELGRGEPQMIEAADEPRTLVSLRENAAGKVDVSALRERLLRRLQRRGYEEPEFDALQEDASLNLGCDGGDGEANSPPLIRRMKSHAAMRHENGLAEGCTMGDSQTASHVECWSTWDYAVAAAYTALLIVPAPFFWAPPAWVWALMSLPGRPAEAARVDNLRATHWKAGARPAAVAANDNAAEVLGKSHSSRQAMRLKAPQEAV